MTHPLRLTEEEVNRVAKKPWKAASTSLLYDHYFDYARAIESAVLRKVAEQRQQWLDEFIASMSWSKQATDFEKELVLGNVQGFAIFVECILRAAAEEKP